MSKQRIAVRIVEFVKWCLQNDAHFTAENLRSFVGEGAAPASADRVLRALRQQGIINYRVVDRANSLYEALPGVQLP